MAKACFFTLNENILTKWEQLEAVRDRAKQVAERYAKSNLFIAEDITTAPRFLLLHTLAHLLIREFEKVAGYPAASLNERIYCSRAEKIAGVLIYTAVPDVVGSLGGIVESSEPKSFLKILSGAFKQAQWCSLDPVCAESQGQGPGHLNRAACHACLLLPETSCDYANVFLDRVLVKGNDNIPNLLDFIKETAT